MPDAFTGYDRIAMYLSGGASNQSPAAALGGLISSRLIRGMAVKYVDIVAGVVIEDATPENGVGVGTITISGNSAIYTPPDGLAGTSVAIAAGERKILLGANPEKGVRLYRPSGATFEGTATFNLIDVMNGVFAMSDVANAVRSAGGVHYRAFFIKALDDATNIKLWVTTDGQASFSLAMETSSAGAIQTIANATTAPTAVSWVNATSEGTALSVGALNQDDTIGIWVRRTFPSGGSVSLAETVSLHLKHDGL